MSGNKPAGLVLQERDLRLFRELGTARIVDRSQAMLIGGFSSVTRANGRLLKLSINKFLMRYRLGTQAGGTKFLYTLTAKAAVAAGIDARAIVRSPGSVLSGDLFVAHQLRVNEVLIAVKFQSLPSGCTFDKWNSFRTPLHRSIPLTPDGYFELTTPQGPRAVFVEVDLGTESRKIWRAKTDLYIRLAASGEFSRLFSKQQFRVAVVTTSMRRMESIRTAARRLTKKLFWFSTFDSINERSFWSPIWLRPEGEQKQELL